MFYKSQSIHSILLREQRAQAPTEAKQEDTSRPAVYSGFQIRDGGEILVNWNGLGCGGRLHLLSIDVVQQFALGIFVFRLQYVLGPYYRLLKIFWNGSAQGPFDLHEESWEADEESLQRSRECHREFGVISRGTGSQWLARNWIGSDQNVDELHPEPEVVGWHTNNGPCITLSGVGGILGSVRGHRIMIERSLARLDPHVV